MAGAGDRAGPPTIPQPRPLDRGAGSHLTPNHLDVPQIPPSLPPKKLLNGTECSKSRA